jgi:hypothetical protein
MSRRLPLVTVLLVALALGLAGLIARELTAAPRPSAGRPQPAASPAASPAAAAPNAGPAASATAAGGYAVVASRNLFSPTRSEAPPAPPPSAAPPAPVLPKPHLFGVILIEGTPVAYLEDPVSKRVARYRVGDSVAGGTVKSIEADTVQLLRPEGQITVRLHDPTRPRPAALPAPGTSAMPGAPTAPGTPLPFPTAAPQPVPPTPNRPTLTQPYRPIAVPGLTPTPPGNVPAPQ